MANWQTPKTDWKPADGIGSADLNRIESNAAHLFDKAAHGKKLFTASGTFVVPAGVTKVWVSGCGGGGGSGYETKTVNSAVLSYIYPGAGGESVFKKEVAVTPGENISVVVGTAGAKGRAGGASKFGNYVIMTGGDQYSVPNAFGSGDGFHGAVGGSTLFGVGTFRTGEGYGAGGGVISATSAGTHAGTAGVVLIEW